MTTMLDAEEYTKEELADLFIQRWNIESPPRRAVQTHLEKRPFRIVLPHPTPWSVGLRRDLKSFPGSLDLG